MIRAFLLLLAVLGIVAPMLERASVQAAHDAVFAEVRRGW